MSTVAGPPGQRRAQIRLVSADEPSDADLVRDALTRTPLSAARVWERYSALVRRILRRSLGPSVDVEDAVQETFLRLFRDLEKLRDPNALRSFLIGITLHVATSELRRRRARRWLLLADDPGLPEPPPVNDLHQLEAREALRQLYRVLDRVDTQLRLAFVMRYVEGMELTELSTVLGCSLATTKRRVAEAVQRVTLLAANNPALRPYLREDP